jgi:hypothetical protein
MYRQSKSTLLVLFLPGLINLTAFYSLAWHMYITFGDWPPIGKEGFPDALLLHDSLAIDLFTICLCFPLVLFGTSLDRLLFSQTNQTHAG